MAPLFSKALKISAALIAARALLRRTRRIDFAGRAVVISGGSRGLGLELARCFAAEWADIALLARDDEELQEARQELESNGVSVLALRCDIRKEHDVGESIRHIMDWRGRIDVVVNNAGVR